MRKHLLWVLYIGLITVGLQPASFAQGIVATHTGDGRLVYENDLPQSASPAPVPDTGLVYWSNREHRWKPVPPIYTHSRRAAQSAADEVRLRLRQAALINPALAASGNALQLASEQVKSSANPQPNAAQDRATTDKASYSTYSSSPAPAWMDNIVEQAALRQGVDPNLVRAIIKVESNFNPQAVSRKGAIGLMQLMPGTAKSLNVRNPYDPAQNVDAGVRHFKQLLDSYGGNLELSLAAYNAGATAVHKSRGVPNYSETRNYVKRITGLYGADPGKLSASSNPMVIRRDADGHVTATNIE